MSLAYRFPIATSTDPAPVSILVIEDDQDIRDLFTYLQSLAPVPANPPKDALPLQILLFSPERTPAAVAVIGLLVLTAAILVLAALRARRLEIDYAAE